MQFLLFALLLIGCEDVAAQTPFQLQNTVKAPSPTQFAAQRTNFRTPFPGQSSFRAPIPGQFTAQRSVMSSHNLISTAPVTIDGFHLNRFEDGIKNRQSIVRLGEGIPAQQQRVTYSKPSTGIAYRSQLARSRESRRGKRQSYNNYHGPMVVKRKPRQHHDHYVPTKVNFNSMINRHGALSSLSSLPSQNFLFGGSQFQYNAGNNRDYNMMQSNRPIRAKVPQGSLPHYSEPNPEWVPLPGYEHIYPHPTHYFNSFTDPNARAMIQQWLHQQ